MGLFEVNEAAEVVTEAAASDANIIFGAVIDESMGDELRVTVIATGFGEQARAAGRLRRPSRGLSGRRRRRPPRRERANVRPRAASARQKSFDIPDEVLDVPSFLRDS